MVLKTKVCSWLGKRKSSQIVLCSFFNVARSMRQVSDPAVANPVETDLGIVDPLNPVINTEVDYTTHPMNWGTLCRWVAECYRKNPLDRALRYPVFRLVNSR